MASSCYPFDDNASEISVASSIGSTGSEEYSLQSHSIYKTCCERSLNHHSLGTYCDFNLAKKVTCVALDCEFVGVGPSGKQSALGKIYIYIHAVGYKFGNRIFNDVAFELAYRNSYDVASEFSSPKYEKP